LKERNQIQFKYIFSHLLLLPVLLLLSLIIQGECFLFLTIVQTFLLILFFAGYWEFQGVRFRWSYCSAMEIMNIALILANQLSSTTEPYNQSRLIFFVLLELYLLFTLFKIILVIFKNDQENVEIRFPFKHGAYLITDGGNSKTSRLMNYHFHSPLHKKKKTNLAMLYATDIVKLSEIPTKFLPFRNEDYPIFDEEIVAPIEGVILKVINDIEDNQPFSGNYKYNTGNTVVIKKDNFYFLLGHLKKGSIEVKEGDFVHQNDLIGKAGNSGMSERPHLHMQLMKCESDDYWKGRGVCIRVEGKNLYKNRLITVLQL